MIAYIRDLAVGRQGWLAKEAFQDGVALCQMIPGATAMQVAAYVGLLALSLLVGMVGGVYGIGGGSIIAPFVLFADVNSTGLVAGNPLWNRWNGRNVSRGSLSEIHSGQGHQVDVVWLMVVTCIFHTKPASDSTGIRPPIPFHSGH